MTKNRTTRKNRIKKMKHESFTQVFKKDLVKTFLEMLNTVKLYHWNTHSYPQHKATDELYDSLNGHIDHFVEVLLGKDGSRINQIEHSSYVIPDPQNTNDIKKTIEHFKDFLVQLPLKNQKDSDLANIRDEIMADLNKFLYLLTLQ